MIRYLIFLMLFFSSCQGVEKSNTGWQKVFQNDAEGNAIYGDKSNLIDAVRLGYPIRIGWGGRRVEHVADADFLTILNGEVFAQIKSIVGQAPSIQNDSVKIRFRLQNHWTKMAGTNGYYTSIMTDYFQDTLVGGGVDRYTATTWYVLQPDHDLDIKALPLWRKESPLWEEWNKNNLDE